MRRGALAFAGVFELVERGRRALGRPGQPPAHASGQTSPSTWSGGGALRGVDRRPLGSRLNCSGTTHHRRLDRQWATARKPVTSSDSDEDRYLFYPPTYVDILLVRMCPRD
ncbi:hypothetical protein EVAR_11197_1 [Eumeta japonica]|uniref:Uncharacterized protein n=1 Tax=Eumeta variegata TaxID=151549 RepID=A0A4C1U5P1_EUMVA|nr:hypothetical protein EVAR_11197_1 [Eumeta japonica]